MRHVAVLLAQHGCVATSELPPVGFSQAVSVVRPFERRRRMMARPDRVRMRERKPCLRLRRRLLGWYVRFMLVLSAHWSEWSQVSCALRSGSCVFRGEQRAGGAWCTRDRNRSPCAGNRISAGRCGQRVRGNDDRMDCVPTSLERPEPPATTDHLNPTVGGRAGRGRQNGCCGWPAHEPILLPRVRSRTRPGS